MTDSGAAGVDSARRLSILVVGPWMQEPTGGGVRTSVATLVQSLSQNHAVSVFVEDWSQTALARERIGPLNVYRRRMRGPLRGGSLDIKAFVAWLLDLPATLRDLRTIWREQRIDIMHLHQIQAGYFVFSLARLFGGPPYVTTFRGRDAREYSQRSWPTRWLIRQVARRASGFAAVSESLAEIAQAKIPGVSAVRVIRNGVPMLRPEALKAPDRPRKSLPSKFFLSVGRLYPLKGVPLKGHDLAIRAWGCLRNRFPDIHLVIAGDDTERSDYEALARACDCAEHVHIIGAVPRSELLWTMSQALGLVAASRSEGMPNAVLEAGSLARPVIASDIPAFMEFLEHEVDSLIVPVEKHEPIAAAVTRLLEEPGLGERLGQALSKKVTDQFPAERVGLRYTQMYRDALLRN